MTSPIAKAIAERLWPVTRSPQTPVEQEMYDIATRFVRGDFDDLLPAYTTEVATVGNTRYLMPSQPSIGRPVLSDDFLSWLIDEAPTHELAGGLLEYYQKNNYREFKRRQGFAAELRAWEAWKKEGGT